MLHLRHSLCVPEQQQQHPNNNATALTRNDFRTLKVLVRMQIAGRQRKIEPDQDQQQIQSAPHLGGGGR